MQLQVANRSQWNITCLLSSDVTLPHHIWQCGSNSGPTPFSGTAQLFIPHDQFVHHSAAVVQHFRVATRWCTSGSTSSVDWHWMTSARLCPWYKWVVTGNNEDLKLMPWKFWLWSEVERSQRFERVGSKLRYMSNYPQNPQNQSRGNPVPRKAVPTLRQQMTNYRNTLMQSLTCCALYIRVNVRGKVGKCVGGVMV
jgi:hypothetical protein